MIPLLRRSRSLCRAGRLRRDVSAQGKEERRAAIGGGLRPNAAVVLANDALHGRQADSGPFELLSPMKALEDAEKLVGVLHVEADTVVANVDNRLPVGDDLADLYHRFFARSRELHGIRQQIREHDVHQARIAHRKRKGVDSPFDVAIRDFCLHVRQHLRDE